jgi:poly(A) polymerase Pap1
LGVVDAKSDIDMVVVTSSQNGNRSDLMTKIHDAFKDHPEILELQHIDQARIPLISFICRDVDFDITLAVVVGDPQTDINNLHGVDEANELSLGGPKHTEYILSHVINKKIFAEALAKVRVWAKSRALYGSKFGFLGGVSWAIMTAFICHRDCSSVNTVLKMFFCTYSSLNWKQHLVTLSDLNPRHVPARYTMAVMTPVFPVINAAQTVNPFTLELIVEEMARGFKMMVSGDPWEDIVSPIMKKDFLRRYPYQLTCTYDDKPDNSIISAKWLKLSFIMSKYPLQMKSVVWPHVINNTKKRKAELAMCLGAPDDLPKGSQIVLAPAIQEWKRSLGEEIEFDLQVKRKKRKKKTGGESSGSTLSSPMTPFSPAVSTCSSGSAQSADIL